MFYNFNKKGFLSWLAKAKVKVLGGNNMARPVGKKGQKKTVRNGTGKKGQK